MQTGIHRVAQSKRLRLQHCRSTTNTSKWRTNQSRLCRRLLSTSKNTIPLQFHSLSSEISDYTPQPTSPAHQGIRDAALFPGFEVAGIIEELGGNVGSSSDFRVGQRVILYPFEDLPAGYAEYIVVPELKYLIVVPDELKLSVAAMLPTGALLAMNTILESSQAVSQLFEQNAPDYVCKILIVGTGGLALWAVRLAAHSFSIHDRNSRVKITMACLKDEGFKLANGLDDIKVVQWSEDLYETQLIERTKDACDGEVILILHISDN